MSSSDYWPPASQSDHLAHGDAIIVKRRREDCLPCRIFGGLAVVGVGAYLFTLAKRKPTGRPRITLMVVSGFLATVGVSRMLNIPLCSPRTENKFWRPSFDEVPRE